MKALFKNPLTLWLKWYIQSRKVLNKNKDKNLVIGYMSNLVNVEVGKYNTIYSNVTVGNSKLGNYVYIADGTIISNSSIGNFCSIGSNVKIGLGMHPTNFVSTFPAFFSIRKQGQVTFVENNSFEETGSVVIGNDVWIGYNSIIMDNIVIGDGAIVGAGAVVTKDVKPYSIVGGVPAKHIKNRFNDDQILKLIKLKWWNNDEAWIKINGPIFCNPDVFFQNIK